MQNPQNKQNPLEPQTKPHKTEPTIPSQLQNTANASGQERTIIVVMAVLGLLIAAIGISQISKAINSVDIGLSTISPIDESSKEQEAERHQEILTGTLHITDSVNVTFPEAATNTAGNNSDVRVEIERSYGNLVARIEFKENFDLLSREGTFIEDSRGLNGYVYRQQRDQRSPGDNRGDGRHYVYSIFYDPVNASSWDETKYMHLTFHLYGEDSTTDAEIEQFIQDVNDIDESIKILNSLNS